MHEATMLLLICHKGILSDLLLCRVPYEDSDSILNIGHRSILTSLVPWEFAEGRLITVFKELNVVKWVLVIIAPIKFEGMDDKIFWT